MNLREKYLDRDNGLFDEKKYSEHALKSDKYAAGFIAQATKKIIDQFEPKYSETVVAHDDLYYEFDKQKKVTDRYTLAQTALIPFLVAAIQDQQAQINNLNSKIDELIKKEQ